MPTIKITGQQPPDGPTPPNEMSVEKAITAQSQQRRRDDYFAQFGKATRDAYKNLGTMAEAQMRAEQQAAAAAQAAQKKMFDAIGKTTSQAMKDRFAQTKLEEKAADDQAKAQDNARKKEEAANKKLFGSIGKTTTQAMKDRFAQTKLEEKAADDQVKAQDSARKKEDAANKKLFANIGKTTTQAMQSRSALSKAQEAADKKMFANIGTKTTDAMKFAAGEAKKTATLQAREEREAERAEKKEQAEKAAKWRSYGRLARTTAMVASGVHGDVEGFAAGAGALIGAGVGSVVPGLGTAIGAEIGEVLGEVVAKVGLAAIKAPMAMGNMYDAYMSMTAPYYNFQRQAADLGGTGGFNSRDLMTPLRPPGKFKAPGWMGYYDVTAPEALQMLDQTGIAPRSGGAGVGLLQDMLAAQNTQGFRGLDPGAVSRIAGSGISMGLTTPGGAGQFLSQFGNVLQKGVPLDIDRSKLLAHMEESLQMIAKSGSQNVNVRDTADLFMRFMNAGGPGRGGETASNVLAGTSGALSNLAGSSATMFGYQKLANAHNNFKTEGDIEAVVGKDAFAKMKGDPGTAALIQNVLESGADGNLPAQSMFMQRLLTPSQYIDAVTASTTGGRGYMRDIQIASQTGNTPGDVTLYRSGAVPSPGIGLSDGGPRQPNHFTPTAELDALASKVSAGTATDEEKTKLLSAYGMPPDQIPTAIKVAKERGINPMWLAIIGRKESNFDRGAHPTNKNGTVDYGVDQINSSNMKGYTGDKYDLTYQNNKAFDVLTTDGTINPFKYNPGDPSEGRWLTDEAARWQMSANRPEEGQFRANQAQSQITGAATEADMLGGKLLTLTTGVDAATTALKNFTDQLTKSTPGTTPETTNGHMPNHANDLRARVPHGSPRYANVHSYPASP